MGALQKHFPHNIETKRLIGAIPTLHDLDEYCAMLHDQQFIDCYGVAFNTEQAHARIVADIAHWAQYGFGPWFWRDEENNNFVGRAGLRCFAFEDNNEVEVAYAINPQYWGKAIAVEMSLTAIELAFKRLSLPQIICFTRVQNQQSLRVMQKLGFLYEKDFLHLNMPHKLHRLNSQTDC